MSATGSVAVVGLGLMGGSLCRALRASPHPPRILAADADPEQGARALQAGVVDHFESGSDQIVAEAEIVVYAAPLGETVRLMKAHAALWREGALITDVVSLKVPILREAVRSGFADRLVGAHPICGGESSGFAAARADLFEDAPIWLCADPAASESVRARGASFWRGVGGIPRWIEPAAHDEEMAWVSHLPQLVANALAGALDSAGYRPEALGPGGRDMTRLAGSNPEVWKDLLELSAPVTGAGLSSVSKALNVLADLLAKREIDKIVDFMARTRRWREGER